MAKNYKLLTISMGATNFTENGNGMYVHQSNPEIKKHIMDFFGRPGVVINTVTRVGDGVNFTVGDALTQGNITSFFFDNKILKVRSGLGLEHNFDDINKYAVGRTANAGVVEAATATTNGDIPAWLKKIEEKILKERPIRLAKFFKKDLPATVEEFLINFFREYNNNHDTRYVDVDDVQTDAGCRRSMGDLYLLVKYYYPSVTFKQDVLGVPLSLNKFGITIEEVGMDS